MVGLENKAQGAGRRAVADFAVITVCGKQHPCRAGVFYFGQNIIQRRDLSAPFPFAPILFGLALYRRMLWVLTLDPVP